VVFFGPGVVGHPGPQGVIRRLLHRLLNGPEADDLSDERSAKAGERGVRDHGRPVSTSDVAGRHDQRRGAATASGASEETVFGHGAQTGARSQSVTGRASRLPRRISTRLGVAFMDRDCAVAL
jgi:hypothetical protein